MSFVLTLMTFAALHPITKTAELVGDWEGLSLCADKVDFPSVHDEQVVYHVSVGDASTVLVTMNKIVAGKEEAMADKPFAMHFDAKAATLTGHVDGRKPSDWTFHLSWSTWTGTARDSGGKMFRNILVKRR